MVPGFHQTLALSLLLSVFAPGALAAPAPATAAPAPATAAPAPATAAPAPATAAPAPRPAMDAAHPTPAAPRAQGVARGGSASLAAGPAVGGQGDLPWSGAADRDDREPRKHQDPPAVAIAVPIAFFVFVLLLVAVIVLMGFRKERLRHETLRLMVERGAEIPVELLTGPRKKRSSDLRRGVILLAGGVGLGLFIGLVDRQSNSHAWSMGFIPAFIGLGYLLVWRLEGGARDQDPPAGSIPATPRALPTERLPRDLEE